MRNNDETQKNLKVGAIIRVIMPSRLPTASANLVILGNATNATAPATLPETASQRRSPPTTTTTTPVIIRAATLPTATLTTEKAVENTPHAAPARRQTTLRTDASIRRSTRKLKRHWQQKPKQQMCKHGEPALTSASD